MKITAVTALYDIGREFSDGRTIKNYLDWLNKSLEVPLNFIVFLDPLFDATNIVLKPGDRIVRLSTSELHMFSHLDEVKHIIATSRSLKRRDLTFRLPEYGLLVMSKTELINRAACLTDANYLLWMDAGLSRFLPCLKNSSQKRIDEDSEIASLILGTSYYLAQRQRIGRLPKSSVGSAMAFMSGGDFLVSRQFSAELNARLRFMVETEWLPSGLWDNEQMALGCLLFRGGIPGARVLQTDAGPLAPITRWLFDEKFLKGDINLHVLKRFLRDEILVRLTPVSRCYQTGDFPEGRYRDWLKNGQALRGVSWSPKPDLG